MDRGAIWDEVEDTAQDVKVGQLEERAAKVNMPESAVHGCLRL